MVHASIGPPFNMITYYVYSALQDKSPSKLRVARSVARAQGGEMRHGDRLHPPRQVTRHLNHRPDRRRRPRLRNLFALPRPTPPCGVGIRV